MRSLEELPEHGQGLAKGSYKCGADMALAVGSLRGQLQPNDAVGTDKRRGKGGTCLPVVAHGMEDGIIELNGARDEQGGVFRLGGHGGMGPRLFDGGRNTG
jgi:hypothetical protein